MSSDQNARPISTILLCAAVQGVGGGLGWSLLPPLMPQIAGDLHIGHAMGGLIWGAAPLGIALASPVGGVAVDRYGPRLVAGIAMLVGALACASRAVVVGPWSLALSMLIFGLHIGFAGPSVPKALVQHLAPHKVARANGLAVFTYTMGTAATVLFARTHLAPAFGGWRNLMIAAGVAMALVGVLWLIVVRDRAMAGGHAKLGEIIRLVGNRQLLRVAFMHFLLFGGYLTMLGLLPRALLEAGLPGTEVGIAIASWLAVAGVANFAGPWLSDRIGRRKPLFLVGAMVAGLALAGFAAFQSPWFLAIAAIGGGCFAPLLLTTPLEMRGVGPARAGAALGLLMLVGQIGGFVLPIAAGTILAGSGLVTALAMLAVAHALIMIPALGLHETGKAAATPATAAPPAATRERTVQPFVA